MQLWLLEKSSPATVLQSWHASYSATEVARGVGVVIYAAAPPSRRTIGQVNHSLLHCLHCVELERVSMCRGAQQGAQDTNQWIEGFCGEVLWWFL